MVFPIQPLKQTIILYMEIATVAQSRNFREKKTLQRKDDVGNLLIGTVSFSSPFLKMLLPTMQSRRFSPGYESNLSEVPQKECVVLQDNAFTHHSMPRLQASHTVVLTHNHTLQISQCAFSSFHR
jgi:hypothetical protein